RHLAFLFCQAEDGIRDDLVTGVQTLLFRSKCGAAVPRGSIRDCRRAMVVAHLRFVCRVALTPPIASLRGPKSLIQIDLAEGDRRAMRRTLCCVVPRTLVTCKFHVRRDALARD